jgi:hypothetical protein
MSRPGQPASGRGSLLQSFRAVAWSFFGIRRARDYERDVSRLNPVHVVIAGIVGALIFIGALVLVVQWVVSSGVAG